MERLETNFATAQLVRLCLIGLVCAPLCLGSAAHANGSAISQSLPTTVKKQQASPLLARRGRSKKAKRRARKRSVKKATQGPSPDAAPTAPKTLPPAVANQSAEALLQQARQVYDALEYDQVIPLAEAVLAQKNLPLDVRLDAFLLQGSAMAIVGDPIDAEKPFRLLLRARTDFNLPQDTPPKILAVFRKVQVEETELARELTRALRHRIIRGLALNGQPVKTSPGGRPIFFDYRLTDPTGAVRTLSVNYRRQGQAAYSAQALTRRDAQWRGGIPGDWTANTDGFVLQYFVVTSDDKGALLSLGSAQEPLEIQVTAGSVDRSKPPPLPVWGFVTTATTAGGIALIGASLTGAVLLTQKQYADFLAEGQTQEQAISGATLKGIASTGSALTVAQFSAYGVAAAVGLGAGIMAIFTNWSGEKMEELDFGPSDPPPLAME